jgi:hypothetical protein
MSAQTEVPPTPGKRIHTVRIFPPIGIARVGNSVENDGWFYGPEVPGRFDEPEGGFKDVHGAVKRQVNDTYLPMIIYGC